ncbi:MAG: hypothetical protein GY727_13410 [Gammaproteobacteria bacterium]|nr:hypothetical protein [Gammaproteobacteria bacterium]MCP4088283.1 hypothetical protein [Gammaproteobacteria bacterium]MCP4276406.1 hypothetical protein [Gammaproteobacteria bacterium]MCP4831053.1 hypothetical protein [Gammaproteobacteria bacterium]MCP4927426.1 hypothetical protein [Gammaproteobacteria bacterium]
MKQRLMLSIIAGSILAFCSVVMASEALEVTDAKASDNLSLTEEMKPGPLGLVVSGASSGINTDYFTEAAAEAIIESGIFSGIDDSKKVELIVPMLRAKGAFPSTELSSNTPYLLKIRVIKVDAPSFSISMTVTMDVMWTLYRTVDNTTLMHEKITSTYTGGAFEGGIIGANRVRVGTEGAVRENISIGVGMLEAVEFAGQTPNPE